MSEANLLLVVMDASSSWITQQMATVEEVLSDLDAGTIPRLIVFNKADRIDDPFIRKRLMLQWPDAIFTSAFEKESIGALKAVIAEAVREFTSARKKDDLILHTTNRYLRDDR